MTFYEKLEKHLSKKQHVLIQRVDDEYCIFSHLTDHNGNYRDSGWRMSKERAMQQLGGHYGYTPERVNECAEEYNWKIVEAFDVPQEQFKKGEVVVIADNAQELCKEVNLGWNEEKKAMIGKECEIKEVVGSDYLVYTPDRSDYWAFPHSALSYPVDEEDNQ